MRGYIRRLLSRLKRTLARYAAKELSDRGIVLLYGIDDPVRAIVSYTDGIELLEEIPDNYKDEHVEFRITLALIYGRRGDAYYNSKYDIEKAIRDYSKAIEILETKVLPKVIRLKRSDGSGRKKILTAYRDKRYIVPLNLAKILNARGRAYISEGEFKQAIKDFSTAIRIIEELILGRYNYLGAWKVLIEAYIGLGNAYNYAGDIYKAVQNYEKAIDIIERSVGSKVARSDLTLLEYLVLAYNEKGVYYIYEGDLDKAFEEHSKTGETLAALNKSISRWTLDKIAKRIFLGKSVDPKVREYIATPYINGGIIYRELGGVEKAIEIHSNIIGLIERRLLLMVKFERPILLKYLALAYNERGKDYEYKGELEKALKDYKKAIKVADELFNISKDPEVPYVVVLSYYNLAKLCRKINPEKSLEVLSRLKEILARFTPLTAKDLEILLRTFEDMELLESFEKALELILKLHFSLKRLDIAMKFRDASKRLFELYERDT